MDTDQVPRRSPLALGCQASKPTSRWGHSFLPAGRHARRMKVRKISCYQCLEGVSAGGLCAPDING